MESFISVVICRAQKAWLNRQMIKLYIRHGEWRSPANEAEEARAVSELAHRIASARAYLPGISFDDLRVATQNLIAEAVA